MGLIGPGNALKHDEGGDESDGDSWPRDDVAAWGPVALCECMCIYMCVYMYMYLHRLQKFVEVTYDVEITRNKNLWTRTRVYYFTKIVSCDFEIV